MAHLIDKDRIVAEIESRITAYQKNFDKTDNKITRLSADGLIQGLESFLAFLETLEVKEVDLEEEIDKELDEEWYGEYINYNKFRKSAKHFFELGLKAQKG